MLLDKEMKSTRDRILQKLLKSPRSSINELAEAVNINSISVRHHLTNLQKDGFVSANEERHGVGRPRLVYFLTEKGLEQFPTGYLRLTNRLLDQLKETLPKEKIIQIFSQMAEDLADEYAKKSKSLPIEQRLNLMTELLGREGFSIEWEKDKDQYLIHEITCPYYHISQNHPEICLLDQKMISSVLCIPAKKITCVLNGDKRCTYAIRQSEMETAQ